MKRTLAAPLVAVSLLAAGLTACSTGSTSATDAGAEPTAATTADADAFPVTIEHALGETTIEAEPTRVATLGWTDHDHALALGVVPVGATKITWGGNEAGSTDWFDAAIEEAGAEAPVRYDDADGAPIDEVAELAPDLILATNSGITEAEYDKLSKIAPVVAYPEAPWTTSWQDSLAMVGEALGRTRSGRRAQGRGRGHHRGGQGRQPAARGRGADLRLPHHHRPVHDRHLRAAGPAGLLLARHGHGRRPGRGRRHQAR